MNPVSIIAQLEEQWDLDHGFLGRLRMGQFDPQRLAQLVRILDGIDLQGAVTVNRRLVSLLWFMPMFMSWQDKRVQDAGGDLAGYRKACCDIENSIIRILGVP